MKKTGVLLSVIFLIISCTLNDDDNNTTFNQLNGKWFMQSFTSFGPNPNLSEEYILWDFDVENNKLNIVNYFTDNVLLYATGQYNFTQTETQISIENEGFITVFDYEFNENGILTISHQPDADGPLITFTPKEINCIDNPLADYQWLADLKMVFEVSVNPLASQIVQVIYNDECVYFADFGFFDTLNCDSDFNLFNSQGELLELNTTICQDFLDNYTNKRILF